MTAKITGGLVAVVVVCLVFGWLFGSHLLDLVLAFHQSR